MEEAVIRLVVCSTVQAHFFLSPGRLFHDRESFVSPIRQDGIVVALPAGIGFNNEPIRDPGGTV